MRKTLSVILSLTMLFSLLTPSFATNTETISNLSSSKSLFTEFETTDAMRHQINTDFEELNSIGIDSSICSPTSVGKDGLIKYNVMFPCGITNQVTVNRDTSDQLVVNFYEEDIHNEVVFLENGNLLIDGKEVIIQPAEVTVSTTQSKRENVIMPRARASEYTVTLSGSWGKESDYNVYVRTVSGNKCAWGVSTLVGLATGVVATIICSVVNASLGASIGATIFSAVAAEMINHCEIYGMEDAYFSWEFDVYGREDNMSIDYYQQYTGACYSRPNQGGHKFPHTYYYHNYFF